MTLFRRFCLYGFLKNQQYYEPFIILFFLSKGLSFMSIGLLVSFREFCVALLEIPSGAAADIFGRKKSMILSLSAYLASFIVFSISSSLPLFLAAMLLFSVGEAFRTGTHKSIVFAWLKSEGREEERTNVYGTTRSWSKFGSAFSLPISVLLVVSTGGYSFLFLACSIPYFLNILNIISYPDWLDRRDPPKTLQKNTGQVSGEQLRQRIFQISGIYHVLRDSLLDVVKRPRLKRVLIESMCYEGVFKTAKDYIQPILLAVALSISVFPEMSKGNKLAAITGIVYFILHLLSGVTSANAGIFRHKAGGDEKASSLLWLLEALVFLVMGFGIWSGADWLVIATFIILALLQNLWRPLLVGRCAAECDRTRMATMLSVESQSKSLFICVFAPVVGWSVDYLERTNYDSRFLPVPLLGLAVAVIMLVWRRRCG